MHDMIMMFISTIESSPHTTPPKLNNRTIYNYRKALGRKWQFEEKVDDEKTEDEEVESQEDESWEVVKIGDRLVMRMTAQLE
jgi:hypothetical protein